MNWELFTAFLLITAVLVVTPGPIVTLVIATGASQGIRAALTTVAGTTLGNAILLAAIAFGFGAWLIVGSLVEFSSRLRLGRAPFADSLRRLKATPRASLGMTIAHTALGFVVLGAVATSVSTPLISAAKLSGIINRLGAVRRFCEMRSTTGMKMATTAVELIREPRPPTAAK